MEKEKDKKIFICNLYSWRYLWIYIHAYLEEEELIFRIDNLYIKNFNYLIIQESTSTLNKKLLHL